MTRWSRPWPGPPRFRRYSADDLRAILAAGPAVPAVTTAGPALTAQLPPVPTRGLDAYRTDQLQAVR